MIWQQEHAMRTENEKLRAEVEKLRAILLDVRAAMQASGQAPDGDDDPRRPLASAVWRVTSEVQ